MNENEERELFTYIGVAIASAVYIVAASIVFLLGAGLYWLVLVIAPTGVFYGIRAYLMWDSNGGNESER